MSFFDSFYDEMSWEEVADRLPGELAINSLKRRVINLGTLEQFVLAVNPNTNKNIPELKTHINSLLSGETVDDILKIFPTEKHHLLFAWLDKTNMDRVKGEGLDKIGVKLAFNLTADDDVKNLSSILKRVIEENNVVRALSVLNKAKSQVFVNLVDIVLTCGNPDMAAALLSVKANHFDMLTDLQRLIALKAFAKSSSSSLGVITKLDFRLFTELNPRERLTAINRYLDFFPQYKHIEVFYPSPSEEELQAALFSGCIEFNDEVNEVYKKYNAIVNENAPVEEKEEEEDTTGIGGNNTSLPTTTSSSDDEDEEEEELELTDEPSDYYFKLDTTPDGVSFVITPKSYWDANNSWYDGDMPEIEYFLEAYKFGRLSESLFEFDGDPQKGRRVLVSLGFTENTNL